MRISFALDLIVRQHRPAGKIQAIKRFQAIESLRWFWGQESQTLTMQ